MLRRNRWWSGLLILTLTPLLHGDEGMWTFDNLPLGQLKAAVRF